MKLSEHQAPRMKKPIPQRIQRKRIADVALEVCREQNTAYVWYGNPQLCHDIFDRWGGAKQTHPLNTIATVVGACARSKKWKLSGYIGHLRRKYPVYEPTKARKI